jgi:hypothetical protein
MREIKGFGIVIALLALVLLLSSIGLACVAKPETVVTPSPPSPAQTTSEPTPVAPEPPLVAPEPPPVPPPVSTAPKLPANYTTYMDESNYFSISYPQDWETAATDQDTKTVISNLKSGVPIQGASTIFSAGLPTATGYEPGVSIVVEPIHEGTSTLDGIVDAEVQAAKSVILDYQVLSTVKTTVDGREATIVKADGTIPGGGRYFLSMITLVDETIWVVGSSATIDDFAQWENDLNTVIRSLRISN